MVQFSLLLIEVRDSLRNLVKNCEIDMISLDFRKKINYNIQDINLGEVLC